MQSKTKLLSTAIITLVFLFLLPLDLVEAKFLYSESGSVEKEEGRAGSLAESMLSHEEVMKIAQKHISGYLADDFQTKDRNISASADFIPLYNLHNEVIAYAVPLLERDKEIGYISIGALRDGYDAYDIFIDDSAVQRLQSSITYRSITSTLEERKIIFVPPMTYIVEVTNGTDQQYFEMDDSLESLRDVTESFAKNKDELTKRYSNIQSRDNQEHLNQILQDRVSLLNTAAAVAKEDVSLTVEANQSMFVPVQDGSVYSYGGNQNWYSQSTHRERGCGPVAAANITNYLAKIKNPSAYGALYSGSTTSKQDFVAHMDKMYSYVNPGVLGKISVSGFASAVEKYAKDKNVSLSRVTDNSTFTLDNTSNYIKAGLNLNSPVATLNLSRLFSSYEYEWHWMTITKYYRDTTDSRWIAVSTWGQRRSINYRTHFDAITGYLSLGGGFMYFK